MDSSEKISMMWRLQSESVSALQEKMRKYCEISQFRLTEKLRQDFEEIAPGEYIKFQQSYHKLWKYLGLQLEFILWIPMAQ